jgi:hypothetical protein
VLCLFQTHCPNLQVLDLSNLRTVAHTTAPLHVEKLQEGCQKLRILRITNSQITLSTATLKEQVYQYTRITETSFSFTILCECYAFIQLSLFMQFFVFLYYYDGLNFCRENMLRSSKVIIGLDWARRHEDVWGSENIAPPFLTSALDGVEWSALCPCCFTPGETAHGTHWIGGWVGPRAGLDVVK